MALRELAGDEKGVVGKLLKPRILKPPTVWHPTLSHETIRSQDKKGTALQIDLSAAWREDDKDQNVVEATSVSQQL